jgi:uncharacterized protein
MARPKNIWDAIWGQVELADDEWALIGLPAFQRLRRIHQLAMTSLVFPGANHTRFEHSIGTAHVAGRVSDRLLALRQRGEQAAEFSDSDKTLARLAALLHDIGHGPFSHVSDPFLGRHGHERVGAMAVLMHEPIRDIVESGRPGAAEAIAAILRGEGPRTIMRDIVSGPTDADKIDYLRRDSHYTGVNQGHFDYEYFLDQALGIEQSGESWLGFRANAIWAVEGLILARYQMRRTVYGHRNRVVTDLMLQRGIRAALGQSLPADLLEVPAVDRFLPWFDQYLDYDDWRVFEEGLRDTGEAGRMFRRLRDHDLLKVLVFLDGDDFREALGPVYARRLLAHRELELGGAFSDRLAEQIGLGPDEVIAHMIGEKHVLQPADALDEQEILFETADGRVERFADRSEIFSAHPLVRFPQLVVYAARGLKMDRELAGKAEEAALRLLNSELDGV